MSAPLDEPECPGFETLVEYLRNHRGFDFTGYKRSSLRRRMGKRMQSLHIERYGDYLDYLEVHPEEFIQLFNTILINVTGFFRDMATWEFLVAGSSRSLSPANNRTSPFESGVLAAPQARKPIAWLWCSPRRWALRASGNG
jgi:chemotaxis methyl-accepting protein methylase